MSFVTRFNVVLCTYLLAASISYADHRSDKTPERIAVVGAGASGLTAAYTLQNLGYDVTVFEQRDRVGGKVHSVPFGGRNLEFGAFFAAEDTPTVLALADEFGIPYIDYSVDRAILQGTVEFSFTDFMFANYPVETVVSSIGNYAHVLQAFPELYDADLIDMHPDLSLPMNEFAELYGITPIVEMLRGQTVGYGYGYYEDTPAAYFMKLIPALLGVGPTGLESKAFYIFPTGYQSLWEAVATELDVHLNSEVTEIQRDKKGKWVKLRINGQRNKQKFDRVIISAPMNVIPEFLDTTDEELALFKKVESERYVVSLYTTAGLDGGKVLYFYDNQFETHLNDPLIWASFDPSVPVFMAWQLVDWSATQDEIDAALGAQISQRGGYLGQVLLRREWNYFQHVRPEDFAAGFFNDLDALQGDRGTYYVGGGLCFETVQHSAVQAKTLIEKHFPPRN